MLNIWNQFLNDIYHARQWTLNDDDDDLYWNKIESNWSKTKYTYTHERIIWCSRDLPRCDKKMEQLRKLNYEEEGTKMLIEDTTTTTITITCNGKKWTSLMTQVSKQASKQTNK